MADETQVARLKSGVQEWNQWRLEHPEIAIDLENADLMSTKLNSANLMGANLYGADLRGAGLNFANLYCANLSCADLNSAALSFADLMNANLGNAYLNDASLMGAHLDDADLRNAHLRGAYLRHARLSNAVFIETVVAQVDLREVVGLDTIRHLGPSEIELHSVYLPSDGSMELFLRGVGLPDEWIDIYRAMRLSVINYHSLFISYASQDELLARRLHADLQANGVRCWFAPHSLEPGDFFREKIDQAIHLQDRMLLILSQHSVNSKWVEYEVNQAIDREIDQQRVILYPIRIDNAVVESREGWAAALKMRRHIGDFTHWQDAVQYQRTFDQFLTHLRPKT